MPRTRCTYGPEFRRRAIRIVEETGKPIARVAREMGIGAGTLGRWVAKDRFSLGEGEDLSGDVRARLREIEQRFLTNAALQARIAHPPGASRGTDQAPPTRLKDHRAPTR